LSSFRFQPIVVVLVVFEVDSLLKAFETANSCQSRLVAPIHSRDLAKEHLHIFDLLVELLLAGSAVQLIVAPFEQTVRLLQIFVQLRTVPFRVYPCVVNGLVETHLVFHAHWDGTILFLATTTYCWVTVESSIVWWLSG